MAQLIEVQNHGPIVGKETVREKSNRSCTVYFKADMLKETVHNGDCNISRPYLIPLVNMAIRECFFLP